MPDKTLLAFAEHGKVKTTMPGDGGDAETVLAAFARVNVDDVVLAAKLQHEGVQSFAESWNELMDCIAAKNFVRKQSQPGGIKP